MGMIANNQSVTLTVDMVLPRADRSQRSEQRGVIVAGRPPRRKSTPPKEGVLMPYQLSSAEWQQRVQATDLRAGLSQTLHVPCLERLERRQAEGHAHG